MQPPNRPHKKAYYLIDRTAVYKHKSVLFNQRLIPSNNRNDADAMVESFFRTASLDDLE